MKPGAKKKSQVSCKEEAPLQLILNKSERGNISTLKAELSEFSFLQKEDEFTPIQEKSSFKKETFSREEVQQSLSILYDVQSLLSNTKELSEPPRSPSSDCFEVGKQESQKDDPVGQSCSTSKFHLVEEEQDLDQYIEEIQVTLLQDKKTRRIPLSPGFFVKERVEDNFEKLTQQQKEIWQERLRTSLQSPDFLDLTVPSEESLSSKNVYRFLALTVLGAGLLGVLLLGFYGRIDNQGLDQSSHSWIQHFPYFFTSDYTTLESHKELDSVIPEFALSSDFLLEKGHIQPPSTDFVEPETLQNDVIDLSMVSATPESIKSSQTSPAAQKERDVRSLPIRLQSAGILQLHSLLQKMNLLTEAPLSTMTESSWHAIQAYEEITAHRFTEVGPSMLSELERFYSDQKDLWPDYYNTQ